MKGVGRVQRLAAWIESLPDTIRPVAYGALFIVFFAMMRGAWLILPVAVLYAFATSDTPWSSIGLGVAIVALAMFGGALSGLAYGLAGRRVRTAFRGGQYLAGIVTAAPYMFLLPFIIRLADGEPIGAPLGRSDVMISAIMTLLFGAVIGGSWFAPDTKADA